MIENCLLCDGEASGGWDGGNAAVFRMNCGICGEYKITDSAAQVLRFGQGKYERYKLSGLSRNAFEGKRILEITSYNLDELLRSAPTPRTLLEGLDRVLLLIHDNLQSITGRVQIKVVDWPLAYARSVMELGSLVTQVENMGWIATKNDGDAWSCELTVLGWQRVADLQKIGKLTDQAFVAMWFNPEMLKALTEGIEPALTNAGYSPLRLDRSEYNEKIDDRIIMEIRRSGLVVADFTGDRGGVYYEAGFAHGLAIPVIYTVRKDWLDRLHFDTRQQNYIVWETTQELRERLHNRVLATLGSPRTAGS